MCNLVSQMLLYCSKMVINLAKVPEIEVLLIVKRKMLKSVYSDSFFNLIFGQDDRLNRQKYDIDSTILKLSFWLGKSSGVIVVLVFYFARVSNGCVVVWKLN